MKLKVPSKSKYSVPFEFFLNGFTEIAEFCDFFVKKVIQTCNLLC